MKHQILVIGGGAWGTALANVLAQNNHTDLFILEKNDYLDILNNRTNSRYFPNVILEPKIHPLNTFPDLSSYKMIVLAVPTSSTLAVCRQIIKANYLKGVIVVNAAKGFEPSTNQIMSTALKSLFKDEDIIIGSIMGPGFANEVIANQFTAVNAIASSFEDAKIIQSYFATPYFRVYTSTDLIGAEICSSLKNVIAIAAGIVEGLGYKHNTRAALITRGLKEIMTYGSKFPTDPKTFFGLCGIGDLLLTCSTKESRNYQLGYLVGLNRSADILKDYPYTVEGVNTTKVVYQTKGDLELPIISAVYQVLYLNADPLEAIISLMNRDLKPEF